MSEVKSLTTGQVARYCHVSQATILNWIKKGALKAYTTPGGHHRIPLPDFYSFLEAYEMPVDSTLRTSPQPRVLIVSDSPNAGKLAQTLQTGRFDISLASNEYEVGAQVARLEPNVVVLDMASSALDCLALCRWLYTSSRTTFTLAVGDPGDEETARSAGADAYLPSDAIGDKLEAKLGALLASNRVGISQH